MTALQALPLRRLDETELEAVQGSIKPLFLFLAALPFTAFIQWRYRDAGGTVSGNLSGASNGAFGGRPGPSGLRPCGSFSLGGSLSIHRQGYSLDLSGNVQVPGSRGCLASSKVGG
jgi:hypothetical protein